MNVTLKGRNMNILGIDPGKKGAIVLLNGRSVLASAFTEDIIGKRDWREVGPALASWLRGVHAEHRIGLAVLELYAGRAGEGGGSLLTVGVGWGTFYGLLSGLEIPTFTPASSSWTREMFKGVGGEGKERSVNLCRAMLPDLDLMPGRRRKPHDGLADAACLALWGQTLPIARVG